MAECLLSMDILFMGYNSDRCGLALVVPALAFRGSFSLVTVPFNMLHPSYVCTHTHACTCYMYPFYERDRKLSLRFLFPFPHLGPCLGYKMLRKIQR